MDYLDPAALEFVHHTQTDRAQTETEAQAAKPSRETILRPHETRRKPRQMNVTFPTSAWPEALREMAERWGLRPADLVTWCISIAITAIEQGEVDPPSGEGRRQHHTACEWLDLLWEPEKSHGFHTEPI